MEKIVNGKISENTHVISYVMDLLDVPPFMCSPFIEGWIWSDRPNEILKYIFDELISTYLINSLIFSKNYEVENDEVTFIEAVNLYTDYIEKSEQIMKLLEEYKLVDNDLNYLDLLKSLINLSSVLKDLNIDFRTEAYFSPLEARRSNMLKTDKFDYLNLNANFE